MTPIDRFERQLPASLAELGEMQPPDYLTDVLGQTARTRQRPAWASLERWLPMSASLSPRLAVAAVLALLLAVLVGSLLFGGGGTPPSPLPSDLAVAPSAASPEYLQGVVLQLRGEWG